jgi:XTP/dITP diphosphohydrolase
VKRLVIGTKNPNKVREIRSALAGLPGWIIEALPDGIPDVEETGPTFSENALQKASHFSRQVDALVLADDSGLCIDALNGAPGIRSARYAEDPQSRIVRVLREMERVPEDQRRAKFVCALALARAGRVIWTVECEVNGRIAFAPSGTHGFGYDPIFFLPEIGKTMAELTTAEKQLVSHRGRALGKLREFLESAGTF